MVTDNGTPALDDRRRSQSPSAEVNAAPVLGADRQQDRSTRSDAHLHRHGHRCRRPGPDADLQPRRGTRARRRQRSPRAGVFTWTPTEAQGPGTYTFDVMRHRQRHPRPPTPRRSRHGHRGQPGPGPRRDRQPDGRRGSTPQLHRDGHRSDVPAKTLTFSLTGPCPPAPASPPDGAFTWTPTEAQGPGTYPFTVRSPTTARPTDDFETITSRSPRSTTLRSWCDRQQDGRRGDGSASPPTATDADVPANTLTFSLVAGATPVGPRSNPRARRAFSWTPSDSGTHTPSLSLSALTRADGSPAMFDEEAITVIVSNVAPTSASTGDATVIEGSRAILPDTRAVTDPGPTPGPPQGQLGRRRGRHVQPGNTGGAESI